MIDQPLDDADKAILAKDAEGEQKKVVKAAARSAARAAAKAAAAGAPALLAPPAAAPAPAAKRPRSDDDDDDYDEEAPHDDGLAAAFVAAAELALRDPAEIGRYANVVDQCVLGERMLPRMRQITADYAELEVAAAVLGEI
jgi:ribosomal protein L12E/L44/L45/RPP1/RPP2